MANTTDPLPHEQPAPPRADLWVAVFFFVFGIAATGIALGFPTFKDQRGEIYTAPGLVPVFYGTVITLISIWLGARAIRQGALHAQPPSSGEDLPFKTVDLRLALAAALCLAFTVVLIGHMPFWLAAAVFVAAFVIVFEWDTGKPMAMRVRRIGEAIALGLATGAAVSLIFEKIFYVRLP